MSFAGVSLISDGKPAAGHAINVATASGYHLLVVNGYSRTKATPNGTVIDYLPFMVGGHRWRIRFYPNGGCSESADSISLFICLVDENVTDALKVRDKFCFIDELEKQDSAYIRASKSRNFCSCQRTWGYKSFMKRDTLEKSKHLKDDCFTIRCDLSIVTTTDLYIKVPACSIKQHISGLLLPKEGTDVTFIVSGEKFDAHRCVLAARSAVFKAELFGFMKETTIASVIHIVEAKVFSALLNFIYTDSLPKMEIDMSEDEEKLCQHIDVSSVTTILTLAEQHNCCGLKEVCFEFLKTPAKLKKIVAVDGLEDITRTCPSLLTKLIAKLVCL